MGGGEERKEGTVTFGAKIKAINKHCKPENQSMKQYEQQKEYKRRRKQRQKEILGQDCKKSVKPYRDISGSPEYRFQSAQKILKQTPQVSSIQM
jgi:hypothetical protein